MVVSTKNSGCLWSSMDFSGWSILTPPPYTLLAPPLGGRDHSQRNEISSSKPKFRDIGSRAPNHRIGYNFQIVSARGFRHLDTLTDFILDRALGSP